MQTPQTLPSAPSQREGLDAAGRKASSARRNSTVSIHGLFLNKAADDVHLKSEIIDGLAPDITNPYHPCGVVLGR